MLQDMLSYFQSIFVKSIFVYVYVYSRATVNDRIYILYNKDAKQCLVDLTTKTSTFLKHFGFKIVNFVVGRNRCFPSMNFVDFGRFLFPIAVATRETVGVAHHTAGDTQSQLQDCQHYAEDGGPHQVVLNVRGDYALTRVHLTSRIFPTSSEVKIDLADDVHTSDHVGILTALGVGPAGDSRSRQRRGRAASISSITSNFRRYWLTSGCWLISAAVLEYSAATTSSSSSSSS